MPLFHRNTMKPLWLKIPFKIRQSIKQFVRPYASVRDELDSIAIQIAALRDDLRAVKRALLPETAQGSSILPEGWGGRKLITSSICKTEDFFAPEDDWWCRAFGENYRLHRKHWEFYRIGQGFLERGLLKPGATGLGFGVGREPLPALFARFGCSITATDAPANESTAENWKAGFQHSSGLRFLNERGICNPEDFARLVNFRPVDMNDIPKDLAGFDFVWSSCALEHLGSIEHGLNFIINSVNCLKPGGYAIHTTEINLSSDEDTVNAEDLVFFRKRDLLDLADRLAQHGHEIEPFDFDTGNLGFDNLVDYPPHPDSHLRGYDSGFVITSVAMVIRKGW